MKTLGIILGVAGLIFLMFSPGFGLLGLIIGTLLFLTGARKERTALEERRHQELLNATRQKGADN